MTSGALCREDFARAISALSRSREQPERYTLVLSPHAAKYTKILYGSQWIERISHELRYLSGGRPIDVIVSRPIPHG